MKKFLNMENATLELNLKSVNEYENFLKVNFNDIVDQNFKRVIFNIDEQNIESLYNTLLPYFVDKSILVMISSYLTQELVINWNEDFILVNSNETKIYKDTQIFNLKHLTSSNVSEIADLINDNVELLVEPDVDVNKIYEFNKNLEDLFNKVSDNDINLNGFILPAFLLREHPCNAYLCNGFRCKKPISGLPKYIYVDQNYNVYPHKLIYSKLLIGNLRDKITLCNFLEQYLNSENYKHFQEYTKRAFIKYLANYPYQFIPYIAFIEIEVKSDDK